jgi:hypothetical protein
MIDDTRDKVIRLEAVVENQTLIINEMGLKVAEMHAILLQARGVRWLVLIMATIGGFIAAKFTALMAFFMR